MTIAHSYAFEIILIIVIIVLFALGITSAIAANRINTGTNIDSRTRGYLIGAAVAGIVGAIILVIAYIFYIRSTGLTGLPTGVLALSAIGLIAIAIIGVLSSLAAERINCLGATTTNLASAYSYALWGAIISLFIFVILLVALAVVIRSYQGDYFVPAAAGQEVELQPLPSQQVSPPQKLTIPPPKGNLLPEEEIFAR